MYRPEPLPLFALHSLSSEAFGRYKTSSPAAILHSIVRSPSHKKDPHHKNKFFLQLFSPQLAANSNVLFSAESKLGSAVGDITI